MLRCESNDSFEKYRMQYEDGNEITSKSLELDMLLFNAEKLVSLCNTVIWDERDSNSPLPSLTENINRKDGGIDAEWESYSGSSSKETTLYKDGWNVYQFKLRDLTKEGKKKIFSEIKSDLKGEAQKLYERTGKEVSNYVLFVNLDLSHQTEADGAAEAHIQSLREAIREGYKGKKEVNIEVVGTGEFAAFLNVNPHVRTAYFGSEVFKSWRDFLLDQNKIKPYTPEKFIGRDEELSQIEEFLDSDSVSSIIISGSTGMGKSRVAIEATRDLSDRTIFVNDPQIPIQRLLDIINPKKEIIVVIEDPDEKTLNLLASEFLTKTNAKLVATVPTTKNSPVVGLGVDERIKTIVLNPMEESKARELLESSDVNLDYGMITYIVGQSGGNPGIILAATCAESALKERKIDFFDAIVGSLKRDIDRRMGKEVFDLLLPLSLMTFVGIKDEVKHELKAISQIFGFSNQNEVLKNIEELTRAGVVSVRGSFVEVQPPLLANKMASEFFAENQDEVVEALNVFEEKQRFRLIKRLKMIPAELIEKVWGHFFEDGGDFHDFETTLNHLELLRQIAEVAPERVISVIEEGLGENREQLTRDQRNGLKYVIEELLFHQEVVKRAMVQMALLAEHEIETNYINDAKGVFAGCFWPYHPQLPVMLNERMEVLKHVLSEESSDELKRLGLRAIEEIFNRHSVISLKPSSGAKPMTVRPTTLNKEVWKYLKESTDLLIEIANQSNDLGHSARSKLPSVIGAYSAMAPPEDPLEKCKTLTDWALSEGDIVSVAEWSDQLILLRKNLEETIKRIEEAETKKRFEAFLAEVESLVSRIESESSFSIRLKRWAGKWGYDDRQPSEEEGVMRVDYELRKLAHESISTPLLLNDELIDWLLNGDAEKTYTFFADLGIADKKCSWLEKINELGKTENGSRIAFAAYYAGLSVSNYQAFESQLVESSLNEEIIGMGIITGIGCIQDGKIGLDLIKRLLDTDRFSLSGSVSRLGYSKWYKSLSPIELNKFLSQIVGGDFENAEYVVNFVAKWFFDKKEIPKEIHEILWNCLLSLPELSLEDSSYDFDQIASHMADSDPEKAYALLKKLIVQPFFKKTWKVFSEYGGRNKLWKKLHLMDPKRCLDVIYELKVQDSSETGFRIGRIVDRLQANVIVEFAQESEEKARFIIENISSDQVSFWKIASDIADMTSNQELIERLKQSAYMNHGGPFSGPYSEHLRRMSDKFKQVSEDSSLSELVRSWAREMQVEHQKHADLQEKKENNNIEDF